MRALSGLFAALAGLARALAERADPAPSRLRWRLNRLWRRKGVRRAARLWLPLAAAAALALWVVGNDRLREATRAELLALRQAVAERPEFAIRTVEVVGAAAVVESEVLGVVGMPEGVSALDLDTQDIRRRVEALGWIRTARVSVAPPDSLRIEVVERAPAAVWRRGGALALVDLGGAVIDRVESRADWAHLPLIVGEGADREVAGAMALYAAAADLAPRLIGFVRVGERRWDLELTGNLRIMLPQADPAAALARILMLHRTEGLLGLDVTVVDYRTPSRPTVRLGPTAREALERARDPARATETDA